MRIAIISDTQGPTPTTGGHGLGRATYNIAEGLHHRGHDVTLIAVQGSQCSGRLITPIPQDGNNAEIVLAQACASAHRERPFDVIYDHSHRHLLHAMMPDLPIVNHYHDRMQPYRPCPVLCSEGQRALMIDGFEQFGFPPEPRFSNARVVHNAIDAGSITPSWRADEPPYIVFIGYHIHYKQPILAIQAATLARVNIKMMGGMVGQQPNSTPWLFSGNESGIEYLGQVPPAQRDEVLRGARVVLQLGWMEAGPLINIEANLAGTPLVAWPGGGNLDYIEDGVNGVFIDTDSAPLADAVVDAIHQAWDIPRKCVREHTEGYWGNVQRYIDDVERILNDRAGGATW